MEKLVKNINTPHANFDKQRKESMNMKDIYKQEIEAELERAQAKLAEFETPEKSLTTEVHTTHTKRVDTLKQKIDATMTKLKKQREANEDV